MNNPQNPSWTAVAVTTSFRLSLGIKALIAGLLCMAGQVNAQVPDLTAGDLPVNAGVWINLGPTGVQAWVYRGIEGGPSTDTGLSRQFQVKTIDAGSPAAGVLAVNDVILGANGTGAAAVPFTSDARKAFGDAIGDAEARTPATLRLLVWRAGTTSTMTLTLRTMGAYSATAPFNCPKSAKILDEGLDFVMANEDAGYAGLSALALMAADNPAYPNNAARQARAQTYALGKMLTPGLIQYIKDGNIELGSKIAWDRGLRLVVLSEYYLKTGDAQVLPSIEAIALSIAHGQGANGAVGHLFNTSIREGAYNEPFGRGYTMNASTLPTALGLVLARKCGVTLPELDPAIERVTRTLAGSAGIGTFSYYVEGEPYKDINEDNGKSSLGALVFAMHNDRVEEAKFMANLAVGGASQREKGHITHYFGLLWGPLGCQVGGQAAAVAHFNEIRWMMDLNRHWDGGFEYERSDSSGAANTSSMNSGDRFWMSTAALLTYAMPLKKLEITGKTFATRPELVLSGSEIAAGVLSNSYDAASRTTAELMQDLQFDLTRTSGQASKELAARPADAAAQVPTLIARAADPASPGRTGACLALGEIGDDTAVPTLLALLSDADKAVRYRAAEALTKYPTQLLRENLTTLLQAAIANAKPAFPLAQEDAQQFAQLKLAEVIFGIYGTGGAISNDITGIDRALLYPAIRAFAVHPHLSARNLVSALYNKLTPADVTALSDVLIAGVNYFGVSNISAGPGMEGIKVLERDNWAEGIPLIKDCFINSRFKNIATGLTELQDYGTAALTVTPDPKIIDFLNSMLDGEYDSRTADTDNAQITAIRDALLAASNPPVLPSFKSIQSVTASPAVLTLPTKQAQLNVSFTDLSQGDTVFSWRKVHGPGNVTFSTNDTGGSAAPQVYFEGVPGLYLFEVKASDSRNLTEVTGTVQVALQDSGGSLPANSPPSASAQSVTIPQAIPTPITLTGTDPESYPFTTFEVLSGPSNGTLGGTPPFLTYTSGFNFIGADSLSFRVRDSNGQWSAPAAVSITVASRVNPVGLVVYEPVDYPTGNLNGKSGSSEIGFTGSWVDTSSWRQPVTVVSTSLEYGGLPTAGGSLSNVGSISRSLSPALAASGLLNDGATLWFSLQVGAEASSQAVKLRWVMANSLFGTSGIMDEGAQLGRGVGFYLNGSTAYAAIFTDASTTNDTGDTMFLSDGFASLGIVAGQNRLLVGKITWGATQDTIQLYLPTSNMILGPPVAAMNTVVDQSSFDTINTVQSRFALDEMRLGATLESVLLGTVAMPADSTPPSPNPMAFAVAPSLATPTSATMQAATAFDPNFGVEYYFTCTVGGGHDSGWQSSPVYTDTGLTPGLSYSYTVKARDLSPAKNETTPSAAFSVGTPTATVVPALVDLPQAQAEALITGAGLVVGTVTTSSSPSTEAGDVASQSPSGGASAAVGSAVNLVVSSSVQMATVPNVVGQTQTAAASSLAAANLALGIVLTDYSETIAAGVVMNQNPASGASLPRNAPVELVVSAGSAAGLAPLTQVLLENFESPDVNSTVVVNTTVGGSLPSNGNWGATTGGLAAGRGIIDKSSGAFNALDPNQQAFAIRSTDAGIVSAFNKLGTITAGTKYTVAVDIVKDSGQNDGTLANFQLKSFDRTATTSDSRDATNEGTVILSQAATAPLSGEFKTVTFEYIAASGNPYLTKDLALRITGGANAANMDNVRVWTSGARIADTAAPWSLAMTPADNASAVAVGSNMTMTFSENVVVGNGYVTLKNLTSGSQRLISITDTRQVSFSGSTLTLNPERNLTGLSDYAVLIGYGAVRDLAGNPFEGVSDSVAWNFTTGASSDATAPTLVSITDDRSGSPMVTGGLVTYTVTFSEDIDADTVSASDFGNAGSSALNFMGVTEVSPGVFTVSVIPTSLGTLQFRINAAAALADSSGNALNTNSALADDTVITVNPGILAPVWSGAPVVGANATEDSAYSSTLLNYATDANSDPLTFTKISGPTWLSVAANGALTGTPINSNVGLNTFTVRVTDGNTAPVQATLNISVINTNDAPTFTQNPIYTPLATRYARYASSIASYAADIDVGTTFVFAKTGGPAWLSVAANGDLSGTPSTGDLGTNTFTVTVSDGIAAPISATLPIKVNATEPAMPTIYEPFADNDASLVGNTPGTGLTGTWGGSTAVAVTSPSFFYGALPSIGNKVDQGYSYASSVGTGNSLLNAGLLANGTTLWFSFLVKADDATSTNDSSAFALGSAALSKTSMVGSGIGFLWSRGSGFNGASWGATGGLSATKAGTTSKVPTLVVASVTWGADDTAGETLSIYLPDRSIALPASPAVVYATPALTQSTFKTISFSSSGGDGMSGILDELRFGSSYASVTGQAQITGDSTPPTLAGSSIVDNRGGAWLAPGTVVSYTMTFSEDMNAASVGADDFSNAGSAGMIIGSIVETSPGVFTVQATPTTAGTLRPQVAAGAFLADMGGNLLDTSAAIPDDTTITVVGDNSPPVWTNNPITGANATEDIAYTGSIAGSATNGGGNPLTYGKVDGPGWLVVGTNGTLSGTPGNSDVGANVFTVSMTDGIIATPLEATLNITVINTNNAPTWAANPIADTNTTEDVAYSGTLAGGASDVDASSNLTFAKVSGPAWLSVASDGELSGTPTNSNVGANSFTVSVSDGIAPAVQATLNITIINTNDVPTWASNPVVGANATADTVYSGSIAGSASDVDAGASLTFLKESGPAWLSIASNGALSGTPTNSNLGANTFTLSVSDGIAAAVSATLNIAVLPSSSNGTWNANAAGNWSAAANWLGSAIAYGINTNATLDNVITANRSITLDSNRIIGSIVAADGSHDYTISGANILTLDRTLGAIPAINVTTAGRTLTISSVINGNDGLDKWGAGQLTLNGTAVNGFTGGVKGSSGMLNLNFANLTTPTNLVNSGNTLTLGGGTLLISGNSTTHTNQTLGNVTVNAGGGQILVNPNGASRTATLTLGSITPAATGTLLVGKSSAASGTATITTTSGTLGNGIYGGNMVYFNGTANTGYDWATTATVSPGPYAISGLAGGSYTTLPTSGGVVSTNYQMTASTTLASGFPVNTLKMAPNFSNSVVLDLGTKTLTVDSGGLLFTGTGTGNVINNGTITAGAGSNYKLLVHNYNSQFHNTAANNSGINAAITDNGLNPVAVVITGNPGGTTGLFRLGNILNSFTGGLYLNNASIQLGGAGAINGNTIYASGYSVLYNPTLSTTSAIELGDGAMLDFRNNVTAFTTTGAVTGKGGIVLGQAGFGATPLNFNNTGNTFSGPIEYRVTPDAQNGTLSVNSIGDADVLGSGDIRFGVAGTGTNSHIFNFGGSAGAPSGPLTFDKRRFELAGTHALSQINNNSAQNFTINTNLLASGTGTMTLTLGGSGAGLSTFAGTIINGSLTALNLTKADAASTWVLTNTNTYTGTTTVSAGKLFVNGDQTSAIGAVSVAANATLGGSGKLGGNATIAASGKLEFNLSTAAESHNPLDLVAGKSLAFSGASTLTITSTAGASPGTYTLITGGNNITGVAPATLNLPVGWAATVSISGNSLLLNITSTGGPYQTWAVGGVAFDADTNNDGVKNGMAWLLGAGNASGNASGLLPQASVVGGNLRLTFRCLKSAGRGGVVLKVQSSSDFGASDPWTSHEAAVPDADGIVNGVVFDTTDDGDFINVIADIPAAGANRFGRLQATP